MDRFTGTELALIVAMMTGAKLIGGVVVASAGGLFVAVTGAQQSQQTLAPHEVDHSDAPPAIVWSTPSLPAGPLDVESAEERRLRVVIVANHLDQPWSVAFLPDRSMLVTERPGRLR